VVLAVTGSGMLATWLVDVAGSFVLAMLGALISCLRMVPQARLALSRAPLWGLCPWATILAWVGMALWLVYALMVGDIALALCSAVGVVMQGAVLAYRLPPRRTLASLAAGRLGAPVATFVAPVAARFPQRKDFELAA
jgi:uncharacterized protein with PQ loop repeat